MKFVRKRKTKDPCPGCFLHKDLCLCDQIPKITIQTHVCLVVHAKELKRTTNTGHLALQALTNSSLFVRGIKNEITDLSFIMNGDHTPLLFFPSDNAVELNSQFVNQLKKPILLIVPDGNWRQASKVNTRHKELNEVQRVKISTPSNSTLFLRKETHNHGMATLQAIAYALGIIHGVDIKNQLLKLYDLKLKRTLLGRGQKIPN